jgi:hypothetical protein
MERVQLDLEPLELNTLRLGCVRRIAERRLQSHALGVLAAMASCKMRLDPWVGLCNASLTGRRAGSSSARPAE